MTNVDDRPTIGELISEQMRASSLSANALPKARALMKATQNAAVVYPWVDAPEVFKAYSRNGGDEDFVIIHTGEDGAYWSYKLVVCDESTEEIGENIWITITCHA